MGGRGYGRGGARVWAWLFECGPGRLMYGRGDGRVGLSVWAGRIWMWAGRCWVGGLVGRWAWFSAGAGGVSRSEGQNDRLGGGRRTGEQRREGQGRGERGAVGQDAGPGEKNEALFTPPRSPDQINPIL